jgi:hypothetical protein
MMLLQVFSKLTMLFAKLRMLNWQPNLRACRRRQNLEKGARAELPNRLLITSVVA